MQPDFDRSSYFFPHSMFTSISRFPASTTASLINYVPSIMGGGFQNTFEDSTTDASHSITSVGLYHEDESRVHKDERCQELWRTFRDQAGPWVSHRFTLPEWNLPQNVRTSRTDFNFDDPGFDGSLTREIIATGLSNLDRCPEFYHYSYIKCVLSKKKLTDIEALGSYHYLQYVDVSANKLTTLEALGNLPFLKYLDASHNLLTKILDFKAPHFLTTVDVSRNRFKAIRDLSEFWSITDLNLSRNTIRNIDGVLGLRYLTTLNLSYNRIETIENLTDLRIQFLYLQNNQIQAFDDDEKAMLDTLKNIRTINLSHNQISSLKMFEKVENLECLEMCYNHISQLLDIYYLRNLKYLNKLNLLGNTVTTLRRYVEVCVTNITNLIYLDGEHINNEFWLQKLSNRATDENQIASLQRLRLLMLEELNKPEMWEWLLPYDNPPLAIIILVGLPASKRTHIARTFCKENESVVLGIPYTTRTKHPEEIEGELFYYIDETEFRTMLKEGKFLTYQEHLGFYYGYAHSEFRKAAAGIMLFYTDITMALSIKSRFLNTKLVLTLPSTKHAHLNNLMKSYGIRLLDSGTMKIINSPAAVKYCEMEFQQTKKDILAEDVRVMVDHLVNRASLQADTAVETNEEHDSDIWQIWSASTGYQHRPTEGRTSRHILPNPYAHDPVPSPKTSSPTESFQKNEFPPSKCVSFTANESVASSDHKVDDGTSVTSDEDNICSQKTRHAPKIDDVEFKVKVLAQVPNDPKEPEPIINYGIPEIESYEEKTPEDRYFVFQAAVDDSAPINWYEDRDEEIDMSRVRPSKPSKFFSLHDSYYDIISDDRSVRKVFMDELRQREQLLDLHWSTPGLFRELVFTDLEDETFQKLRQLLRDMSKFSATSAKPMFDFNNDEKVKTLIAAKLQRCFENVERELSITEKQAAEYFVDDDTDDCGAAKCRNPACPPFK